MLSVCKPMFGSGKDVVLDSLFCVATIIIEIKSNGFYVADLINKWRYWPKGVTGDLIDAFIEYKEVGYVGMIKATTEDNKFFNIFCMKDPDYVMKIVASWMTLDESEGAKTRRYFTDRIGTKETKNLTYRQPFGIHFRHRHQV